MSSATTNKTGLKTVPMETLKGVFTVPKMNHRRDFLRENKLNLQQLQRFTCKKKQHQQNEQVQQQQRQQRQHQNQQQMYIGRRSASQQRAPARQQQHPPAPPQKLRSLSQQRNIVQSQGDNTHSYSARLEKGIDSQSQVVAIGAGAVKSNGSICTLCSTASKVSRDKEIQTEDIQDEAFLFNALKKCSSDFNSKVHYAQPTTVNNASDAGPLKGYENCRHFGEIANVQLKGEFDKQEQQGLSARYAHKASTHRQQKHADEIYDDDDLSSLPPPPSTTRSHALNSTTNGFNRAVPESDDNRNHQLHADMEHLTLDADVHYTTQPTNEQCLSGRSRRTICSTKSQESMLSKKTSTGSLQKFGCRDDVRLPRYLEREKREREEQRQREVERDPHCPVGHYALTEQERIATLVGAEKKFKALIEELNHMPMTSETLRIRARKVEIEKELAAIEMNIRIYSKPKVYLKQLG